MLLRYHFGSERLKGTPKKVELVEAVTGLFRRYWESLNQRVGGGGSVVTNEIGEKEIFLVYFEFNGVGAWYGGYAHCYTHWTGTVGGLINGPPVNSLILTSSTQL